MIEDLYLETFLTDIIYGEVKNAYRSMQKLKKYAEKRKNRNRRYEGYGKLADCIIDVMENRISMKEFKKRVMDLSEKYPEIFLKDREETGNSMKFAYSIIHKVEYAINRYDIEYPKYNMQRCDDL
ncbi:MAG: hypothetical protein ACP5RZ_03745 [Thermoplasmata archaeon]